MLYLIMPDLQLFADGADGAGGATGEAPAAAVAGQQNSVPASGMRQSNPTANTIYGRSDEGPGNAQAGNQKMSFDDLLKADPDYKAAYDEKVQKAISGRFKAAKALEDDRAKLNPVLELLAQKYGIKTDDVSRMDLDGLVKAIQEDDSYYEEEALEKGISVDSLKAMKKMQAENAQLKKAMQEAQNEEQSKQQYMELQRQAEQIRQIYPGFDLIAEMQASPVFARMITQAGVPVKTAFEAVHHDDILSGAIQHTARQTQRMAAQTVQANAQRPVENGINGAPAALHVTDPKKLTREQRRDIRARVARGERIVW